eukprot:TRINITY_DN38898_c0_g1_i1.p1 TRINITY_DN38898_c0_g1~~TRINITY_DN38898_c0_g1_i1.p1  ORF type:complete len:342 (-),score=28.94 TRINITY_DN38898_c0_g1_i1:178-1128(-)
MAAVYVICAALVAFMPPMRATPAASPVPASVEVAPGVHMPFVNLGGVHSHPSNYSAWLELGGTGLDTAMMYGDDVQVQVGDAIATSKLPRDKLFVTSKVPCCPAHMVKWCEWYGSQYEQLSPFMRAKIDARLLGVDVIDLVLLHWPCSTLNETIEAYRSLEEFALAGKARAIGISNFNATMIDALYASGLRVPPAVNQCGFSIGNHNNTAYGRDFGTVAKCKERGITYSAYSPLGGLSGVDVIGNPSVKAIGERYGKSSAQVALRWVTQQGVVAVTASDKVSHLKTDLEVFDFTLSDDEMETLRGIGASYDSSIVV